MAGALVSMILHKLCYSMPLQNRGANVGSNLKEMTRTFQYIHYVLEEAEQRQMRERAVREWLDEVKDICYDVEDVLDELITAVVKRKIAREGDNHVNALVSKKMTKVCLLLVPSPSFRLIDRVVLRFDISPKLKALYERLDDISRKKDRLNFSFWKPDNRERVRSVSFIDSSEICGLDDEKTILVSKLLSESNEEEKGLQTISIVGMGGAGKTTLAQLVYNDDKVRSYFDIRMWVCVSNPFDVLRIAKLIMESLLGAYHPFNELETLLVHISQSIVGKKFFLVLDDVWTENYDDWQPLICCLGNSLRGSKILITTRKESVAHMLGSIHVITPKVLSGDECWSLFHSFVFGDRSPEESEKLEDIGRAIVLQCQGLPLAVKVIGSILRFKRSKEEWQMIRDSSMGQIEVFQEVIFPALWFSYHDLPFMVRQCFSFCAIFPKDYRINKDELIRLWMAQGYLDLKNDEKMEAIGENYFNHLVNQSLFQEFERDDNGSIIRCKMHDLVHDFAQSLANNECFSRQVNDDLEIARAEKLRHSTLMLNKRISFPDLMFSAKKLRTLRVQYGITNCSSISVILPKLFNELTSLRALDLSGHLYENVKISIPMEIGKLIYLRYLNLSLLKIDGLPKEVCQLYKLQTLNLSWCTNLKELPQGMEQLISLRHLVNEGTSLSYMPKGIERLTGLLTLSEFVVGGGPDDSKACTIACMNKLQGSLVIKKLGAVTDVSEVKEAELENKRGLVRLCLNFESDVEEARMNEDEERIKHQEVIEALQPPPSLEFLEIIGYKGNIFPDWIMSLRKLKKLNFQNCTNIEHLPALGKLPSLESLSICSMWSVKRVGNKFWGMRSDGASSSSSSSIVAFRNLTSLKFVNMEELEAWENWDSGIEIMPNLQFLLLVHCPKLKALPDRIFQLVKLQELNIKWCPILKKSGQ